MSELDERVYRLLGRRTVAEFSTLPPDQRKAIFRLHLVQDDPVIIKEGDDDDEMNPCISTGAIFQQEYFIREDRVGKQLIKEAIDIYYSHSRKKEDDADAFMRLPDREIVGCINDIGIYFTVEDLQRPNTGQIQDIFEWFIELLLNVTRETVEPAIRAAAEDVCSEFLLMLCPRIRKT
ncbi:kinetochore-associated Ndc80 complex subunit nuf2 [Metarhizium rileyi]|uniref:Probable kinetochore protein NUF2 n=1 Tax=Metarhizium rileyi (strain RCEF 4871) TaxID=1649241 RepID=A0A5C6G4N0_METRR|nr:kinetochore-associated Ndc80 complex subunit nuf2 [Metarhizium rileyi]